MEEDDGRPAPGGSLACLVVGALILFVDGYDLALYGVTMRAMRAFWEISPEAAGLGGSMTPLGMIPGALAGGTLSIRFGRRKVTAVALVWLSLSMLAAALATSFETFVAARFSTGLSIGALAPLALAMVGESAPRSRTSLFMAVALTGTSLGGIVANAIGSITLDTTPFQRLYLLGGGAFLLLPVIRRALGGHRRPVGPLGARNEGEESAASILRPPFALATLSLAAINLVALLLLYGSNVWLTTLLSSSGRFDGGTALRFGSAFFAGALVGPIAVAVAADRWAVRPLTSLCLAGAATAIGLLVVPQSGLVTSGLLVFLGAGIAGAGTLVNAYVARLYPPALLGAVLGFITAVGRSGAVAGPTYLGFVVSASGAPSSGFVALILPALLGAALVIALPAQSSAVSPSTDPSRRSGDDRGLMTLAAGRK